MDYVSLTKCIAEAVVITAGVAGIAGAAAAEFVKQVATTIFKVKSFPPELASILAGVSSGFLCAYILWSQGSPLVLSIVATLIAVYAPQPVHDIISTIKSFRTEEVLGEDWLQKK